jgi:uncharacterized NAD(P)/FAD-binding protein YdhS
MKNITIIGGGACGVAAFLELFVQITTQKLTDQVSITIFERDKPIGYGLAFGTDQPGHLLNTQADLMGLFASEPKHFAEWLKSKGGRNRDDVMGKGSEESVYTTRHLYGDYIAEHFKLYLQKAKDAGIQVSVVGDEVSDIDVKEAAYEVTYGSGKLRSDFVILALGTPKPCNYTGLRKYEEYIDFPYPPSKIINKVKTDASVGVLGSSLSAIDTIMTLVDNGHQGNIILFSPDGLLPRVQPIESMPIKREILSIENLHKLQREKGRSPWVKEVFRMFMQEAERISEGKIDWKSHKRVGKDAGTLIASDLETAKAGGDVVMNLANSLRYDSETIWNFLDPSEKNKFHKWLGPDWAINRHGMPIPNAEKLQTLFMEGRLKVVPFISDVRYDEEKSQFRILISKGDDWYVDNLVNATGAASDLEIMESPLVNRLAKKEMLKQYPVGGAWINTQTMEVIAKNAGKGMYALGHLANGILIDVNAVWFNVQTIQRLSHDLIQKLKHGTSY